MRTLGHQGVSDRQTEQLPSTYDTHFGEIDFSARTVVTAEHVLPTVGTRAAYTASGCSSQGK